MRNSEWTKRKAESIAHSVKTEAETEDFKEKVDKIPAAIVDKALETGPSGFVIYDRECKKPVILEKDNI